MSRLRIADFKNGKNGLSLPARAAFVADPNLVSLIAVRGFEAHPVENLPGSWHHGLCSIQLISVRARRIVYASSTALPASHAAAKPTTPQAPKRNAK